MKFDGFTTWKIQLIYSFLLLFDKKILKLITHFYNLIYSKLVKFNFSISRPLD